MKEKNTCLRQVRQLVASHLGIGEDKVNAMSADQLVAIIEEHLETAKRHNHLSFNPISVQTLCEKLEIASVEQYLICANNSKKTLQEMVEYEKSRADTFLAENEKMRGSLKALQLFVEGLLK